MEYASTDFVEDANGHMEHQNAQSYAFLEKCDRDSCLGFVPFHMSCHERYSFVMV